MNKRLLMLALLSLLSACSDDASPGASVSCGEDQILYGGTCHDKSECLPPCGEGQTCQNGTCVPGEDCSGDACLMTCNPACGENQKCVEGECYDKDACIPECDENEKCVNSTCVSRNACIPECGENERCEEGTCVPYDPTACEGKLCQDNVTYCDDTGHWNTCEAGYGCHLGYCLKGLAPECTDPCSEDGSRYCNNGTWISCGALETCQEGECVLKETACEPNSCSEDGRYYCADGKFETCPKGTVCENGTCTEETASEHSLLWQPCTSNSDCARGVCVFELSTSRKMSIAALGLTDVETIPLSALDSRIAPNTGVCAADCTRSTDICDDISTDKQKFTCQVVVTGDSPYPPKDEEGFDRPLPFHAALDTSAMETAPFASICRPNDITGETYSVSFCKACTTSDECGNAESCIHGLCMPQCSHADQCPFAFTCQAVNGMDQTFCVPNSNTCASCLDLDGDGMGHGACEKTGFDCDDFRSDVFYQKTLTADSCTTNYTDDNCNGHIDYLELLGSPDNCSTCGAICKTPETATSINHACILDNNDLTLDDSSLEAIEQTYVYTCLETCDPGYADCDGDPANGCEVKLLDIQENGTIQVLENDAVKYTLDADKDGHGVMDDQTAHYCCKAQADVCYAMPGSLANAKTYWDKVTLAPEATFATVIDDCDDTQAVRFPGNTETCDGIDNDCDDNTADGSGIYIKLSDKKYIPAQSSDENKLGLDDTCTVYHNQTGSVCSPAGKVICDPKALALSCTASASGQDDSCNNIDDDCDGKIDDDYKNTTCLLGKPGICNWGVKVCSNGKETCQQLYTARAHDFYGDGVDSDCDGVDWDMDKAIYIEKYGTGSSEGNDSQHSGALSSPIATLSRAFTKAKAQQDGKTLYRDIIVSENVSTLSNSNAKWGKEDILIPTVIDSQRYAPALKSAITHQEHVDKYQQNSTHQANSYLFLKENCEKNCNEVYPPKEVIRIYGGFNRSSEKFTGSKSSYERILSESTTSLSAHQYVLIKPSGSAPMSVKLQNLSISLKADTNTRAKQTGSTLIGLTCGKYGCSELTLENTFFDIEAPAGIDHTMDSHLSNEIWSESTRNAVHGRHKDYDEDTSANYTNYSINYHDNNCMSPYYKNNVWQKYSDYTSTYQKTCPDGQSPRGGCGSINCCHGPCKNITTNTRGKNGHGSLGGARANITSANRSGGCDSNKSVDPNRPMGQPGGNGSGGAGGKISGLTIKPVVSSNADLYLATYSGSTKDSTAAGNGKPGVSGGGGGGGGTYHCYDRNTAGFDSWGWAGNGGAGGCGGRGGTAGGTGGSAIGLVLTPPKSGKNAISLTQSDIKVTAGAGGNGQSGQQGISGGLGGNSAGYAKENAFNTDTHCFKATAGGSGGAGGGGGGGAGGLAGQAYGFYFLCNRDVPFGTFSKSQLDSCGFSLDQALLDSPGSFVNPNAMKNGKDGAKGTDGSWSNETSGVNATAEKRSMPGTGGAPGASGTGSQAVADVTSMLKATF